METEHEDLTLDELEKQVVEKCVFYTCDKTIENFINILKKEDQVKKARQECYEKLNNKQLKKQVKDRSYFDYLHYKYNNAIKGKLTRDDYIKIMIQLDEKEDRSRQWKLRYKLQDEKRNDEQKVHNEIRKNLKQQIRDNYKLAKELDTRIDELREKEDKTDEEYDELVDLLLQRLSTKRNITRIIDLK